MGAVKHARILTTSDVAGVLGWDTQRARRWLQRTEAGTKRGGRVITTRDRLASHFPEAFHEVALDFEDDLDDLDDM